MGAAAYWDEQSAAMIREKYDYYRQLGEPIENEIMGDLFNPEEMNRQVMEARGLVSSSFDSARSGSEDFRQRYGDTRTDQERAFEDRRSQLREALAKTEASDGVRGMVFDRDINTATDMTRIGRGMSSSATAGMVSAAGQAAQREAQYEQAKSADQAGAINLGMAGAGVGAYLAAGTAVGGPVGALIGGAVGLGVGMLS